MHGYSLNRKGTRTTKTFCLSFKLFLCRLSMLIIIPGIIMSFQWSEIHVPGKIKMSEPFLCKGNLRWQDSTNL